MNFKRHIGSSQIALMTALSASLLIAILALLQRWTFGFSAIVIAVEFLVLFVIVQILVKHFVENRIKIIYKSIYSQKKSRDDFAKTYREMGFPGVEQEVKNWLRKREVELEKMKEQETYRKEFLGNISHELKTPVFNIQGYITTLLDGAIDDASVNRNYLERAEMSLQRMISMINDLDVISKIENNQVLPNYSNFNLETLIQEIFNDFEMKLNELGITFSSRNKTKSTPMVSADNRQIKQVISNLLENSIRYACAENPYIKITIYDMHEKVLVEVSDNGIGVANADLPRIFERFFRTDKARSREKGGSGLGLAIVKHIIKSHHQNITVRSTLGQGTTFSFTLDKV